MRIDVITDIERLERVLVGRTIKAADIVHESVIDDFLELTLDDGNRIRIDTFMLSPIEVVGVPK